jgi:uncharacterized membrane protein
MFGVPLHRLIVYLPILLALAAMGCDSWAISTGSPRYHETGSRLSKWAALAAGVAVATGFSLAGASGLGSGGAVTGHAGLGAVATVTLLVVAYLRYSAENRDELPAEAYTSAVMVVQICATILVLATAVVGFR